MVAARPGSTSQRCESVAVGRLFAIVLDDKVIYAPQIRQPGFQVPSRMEIGASIGQ